ncbi:hypothetical protein [Ruminococcus sp. NK3A76]|uniref:hypothetical protein n=1 Tax=Ruminococcus sp. NK3A76 TaxID=877411 RepID=UPI00048E10EF|nr:hypothetical protein [Ruminococcus sp. NK3A76]
MSKINPSMGGLEMPEGMDVNQELGKQLLNDNLGRHGKQMASQLNMLESADFANASTKYDGIEKIENLSNAKAKAKREEELDFMKSIAKKPVPTRKTIDNDTRKKIKIGSGYVSLRKFVIVCSVILAVFVAFALFIPPVFVTNVIDSQVGDENIFASKNINELRVEYADKYSMEDNQALKSEKAENYREVYIKFYVVNMSIFQTRIPQFELMTSRSKSPDRIVYVGNENPHTTIQPFSKAEVTVKVLVNVENMTNGDFADLIKGMVFCTVDMDRMVARSTYCPSIPAVIFVSDELTLSMN